MIYTVTFNPAIDHVVHLPVLKAGEVNRASSDGIVFGGKGINVSVMLARLGIKSTALGFVAGFTGDALEAGVRAMGVDTDLIHLKTGLTRINVKIHSDTETEINCSGPDIDSRALDALYQKTDGLLTGDTLVIAGSIPKSLPQDTYEKLLSRIADKGIRIAADAEGKLLTDVLRFRPYVIKPNIHELSDIFGRELTTTEETAECAAELKRRGAQNVLVSMGGSGAFLLDENGKTHFRSSFRGTVINSVGAGDSMLAGFLAGAEKGYDEALLLGSACGSATAFSEGLGDRELIDELLRSAE